MPIGRDGTGPSVCSSAMFPASIDDSSIETEASPFRVSIPFITVEEFTEYCRRVYFATQDFPPAIFIVVNNGLHYLFLEKIGPDTPETHISQYRRCADMCRDNLETGLANFNPFPTARRENIEALLAGVRSILYVSFANTGPITDFVKLGRPHGPSSMPDRPSHGR